jgi:hypothetical protein
MRIHQLHNAGLYATPRISPPSQLYGRLSSNPASAELRQNSSSGSSVEPEMDEINTRQVAARVAAELKRYSVPQAVFAHLVLCRSQGTLSDLLRNPKPWSKLKSGRETFRRMWKWLQEPEHQRMATLRLAGRLTGEIMDHLKASEFDHTNNLTLNFGFSLNVYLMLRMHIKLS